MDCTSYPRPKLAEAKSAEEDWTGLRSRPERRKLQTRLNVRAHRKYRLLCVSFDNLTGTLCGLMTS
jgi:hypothetical protein